MTIVSILLTFVVWGFGGGGEYEEYYDGDWAYEEDNYNDGNDDNNDGGGRRVLNGIMKKASSQKHGFAGIRKLRDYREHVFDPALRVARRTFVAVKSQFND